MEFTACYCALMPEGVLHHVPYVTHIVKKIGQAHTYIYYQRLQFDEEI